MPMRKTISPLELRTKTGQVLDQTFYRGDEFVIARRGKPLAVVVPYPEYEKWQERREKFFARVEALQERFADAQAEEVSELAAEAVQWVRQQQKKERKGRKSKRG